SGLHARGQSVLSGDRAFYFEATLGFPIELTRELATKQGLSVDEEGYKAASDAHKARSRAATRFEGDGERIQTYAELGLQPTGFVGYESTRALAAVNAIVLNGTTIVRSLT